jgi:hypothetical protein
MGRWVLILGLLPSLAGCVESKGARPVPVTPSRSDTAREEVDRHAVTKPPRAIATH